MIYVYYCPRCNHSFEVKKSIADVLRPECCLLCGQVARRKYTPIPSSFGWRLSDKSHEVGQRDELVRDI